MVLVFYYDFKNIIDRNGREFIGVIDFVMFCVIFLDIVI